MSALSQVATWEVPTVAAAVFDHDGVLDHAGPTDRPFELASVSKPLAAFAMHVAVEEGIVTLDDPVAGAPEGATLRHLLAHASGVSPDDPDVTMAGVGERRIYSNAGFELAAGHVAGAAAMSFADYARLAVAEPCELQGTDLTGSPAHGYRASVEDLVTVLRSVLDGRLLAPETVIAMRSPAFPELAGVLPGYGRQNPNTWGLGVEIRGTKQPHWTGNDNSPGTWGHFGRSGTFVWIDPVARLGLVVLTDRDFGPWAVDAWPRLADAVLGARA